MWLVRIRAAPSLITFFPEQIDLLPLTRLGLLVPGFLFVGLSSSDKSCGVDDRGLSVRTKLYNKYLQFGVLWSARETCVPGRQHNNSVILRS